MLLTNYDNSYMYNTYSMIYIEYYLEAVGWLQDPHAIVMRHIWSSCKYYETYLDMCKNMGGRNIYYPT